MTGTPHDDLVEQWLAAVASEGADLSPERLGELLADLREHIAVARAELVPETEAGVRTILERLGDPPAIVAEARRGGGSHSPPHPTAAPARPRSRTWLVVVLVAAAMLCLAGCAVAVVGITAWQTDTVTDHGPIPSRPTPVLTP